jgi:alkylation response protein AidB-like acyl-CoA dehydrogenase
MKNSGLVPEVMLKKLRDLARLADGEAVWPKESWDLLKPAGVLQWCIPREHGGRELPASELLTGYQQLAAECLTTCFILSQREAACRRIRDHGSPEIRRELLPALGRGDTFATVGLSHLTTSRQHTGPAMRVQANGARFILDGSMPWVTGAAVADHFITGGTLDDGRQIMIVLPAKSRGVKIGPSLALMALTGSMTAEVQCENVEVDRRFLLLGPAERVMTIGKGGAGGLETSTLALGLASSAIGYLRDEGVARPDLLPTADRLERTRKTLNAELQRLAADNAAPEDSVALRARVNTLVLRATQAALTASKGAGFLRSHPAQRWVRQAMFFLVWSCPRPAAEATLAYLMPSDGLECG